MVTEAFIEAARQPRGIGKDAINYDCGSFFPDGNSLDYMVVLVAARFLHN